MWSHNIQNSVKEVNEQLGMMQKTVEGLIPTINKLNEMLPVDERLAPFTRNGDAL